MSLKTELKRNLSGMSTSGRALVTADHRGAHLVCELEGINVLALQFTRFAVESPKLADATMDRLKEISTELSRRINYLLEPIGPIEHDDHECVVQMRSTPPAHDDDGHNYYELLVRRGGDITLYRYRKAPAEPRQVVPATVTREVLYRLAEDFEALIQG